MRVLFTRQFEKQIQKIRDRHIAEKIENAILQTKAAKSIAEITEIKKLKGYSNAFRIKIGTYRIGLYISGDTVEFACVLNRKDIYRYFP